LLLDGTVLVTGTDNTAELFSPGTGTFSVVGELLTPGSRTTATLRKDGTVLVAGGRQGSSIATAELFAPESGGFVATGSLITARDGHRATLLVDGTVLVTGGATHTVRCYRGFGCRASTAVLSSAELFK
jgi:WD40 repeat protein